MSVLYLKGELGFLEEHYQKHGRGAGEDPKNAQYDSDRPIEVQSDKPTLKLVPCTGCQRALAVNVFYAPAIARCSECGGGATRASGTGGAAGQSEIVQAGRTDPVKAARLADCLINPAFAKAICPVHPDDEEHVMELKSVNHNERYGPSELIGAKDGRPQYRQIAPGETAMHQCLKCKAIVTYSTTAQAQFRRCNEPRSGKSSQGWLAQLGAREES